MCRYLRALLRNKLGWYDWLWDSWMVHGWDGQILCLCTCQLERRRLIIDIISMRLLLKAIGEWVKLYGYVFITDSENLMQIWRVAFYRIEKYLKLAK